MLRPLGHQRLSVPGANRTPPAPKPMLDAEQSAKLRNTLISEIERIDLADDAAVWAHRNLTAKNNLTVANAIAVESAFEARLFAFGQAKTDVDPAQTNGSQTDIAVPKTPRSRQRRRSTIADQFSRRASDCAIRSTASSSQGSPVSCAAARRAIRTISALLSRERLGAR